MWTRDFSESGRGVWGCFPNFFFPSKTAGRVHGPSGRGRVQSQPEVVAQKNFLARELRLFSINSMSFRFLMSIGNLVKSMRVFVSGAWCRKISSRRFENHHVLCQVCVCASALPRAQCLFVPAILKPFVAFGKPFHFLPIWVLILKEV